MGIFANLRVWYLRNRDTGKTLIGQFEPEDVNEDRGSVYAERFTLGRKKAILQFLHGKTPTVSFTARFYNETVIGPIFRFGDVIHHLDTLRQWSELDPQLGRPPIVTFWVGNSWISQDSVIESVGSAFDKSGFLGRFKGATATISLREFTAFDINATASFDTRFYPAKRSEYYELIAEREYRDPLIGVVLRQRNPSAINLAVGDVVKLPAGTGSIRQVPITQTSIIFSTAFDRQREPTPQRTRHEAMVTARNASKVSHILVV